MLCAFKSRWMMPLVCSTPTSNSASMLGCESAATALASRAKRDIVAALCAAGPDGSNNLMRAQPRPGGYRHDGFILVYSMIRSRLLRCWSRRKSRSRWSNTLKQWTHGPVRLRQGRRRIREDHFPSPPQFVPVRRAFKIKRLAAGGELIPRAQEQISVGCLFPCP